MKKHKPVVPVNFTTMSVTSTLVGLVIIYVNFTTYASDTQLFSTLNLVAAVIMIGVPLLYRYAEYSKVKKIEAMFPRFLRDITENINSGMTLPQAVRSTTTNDYGVLTPYANDISAKISWGITFEAAIKDFADKVGSSSLRRTVQTIIEAHRSGGTMNTVLEAVADSLRELEKIKKERSASVYSQMINGYMIYIIFLGVMVGISSFLVPTFNFEGTGSDTRLDVVFPELFRSLIVIQGFFAGMAIGKMSEGTISAGIKHSLALSILGYSVFILLG
ncbi:MAG: type II secretion system F family protein [Candidatus Aenigmarchaeota archaeon]|nr:type II secretion system F family protein [Candidatus Aenigmarchaeota archaeon]